MLAVDDRITKIYNIIRRIAPKYGISFSFPENTDPQKTYAWRYLTCFARNLESLNITDEYLSQIIEAMFQYAKTRKLLKRGIGIFIKQDILQLCIKKLEAEEHLLHNRICTIKRSHDFLLNQVGDPVRVLASRRGVNTYANMTCWFEQGLLSLEYIAVSKSCRNTFRYLEAGERGLFPPPLELLKLKLKILAADDALEVRHVLGGDLFED
jgi:hypothetical protein